MFQWVLRVGDFNRRTTVHLRACIRPKRGPLSRLYDQLLEMVVNRQESGSAFFIVESTRKIWTSNHLYDAAPCQKRCTQRHEMQPEYE